MDIQNIQKQNPEPPPALISENLAVGVPIKSAVSSKEPELQNYILNEREIQIIRGVFPNSLKEKLLDYNSNPLLIWIQSFEKVIAEAKVKLNLEESYLQKKLIGYSASIDMALFYEKLYSLIFGSQINLLHYLRASIPYGVEKEFIRKRYYDEAVKKYPNLKTYLFESYMNFLESWFLIIKIIEEGNEGYKITNIGVAFLDYTSSKIDIGSKLN